MDAGLEAEERRPIDLLAALVRERAGEGAGVTLTVAGGSPITVDAFAHRPGQALDNLLDNARSFSAPGQAIDVEVGRVGASALVRVRDCGPGIPAEHAGRIFDRFFSHRPDQAGARQKHAGLGLSIARAIVERHGGALTGATYPGVAPFSSSRCRWPDRGPVAAAGGPPWLRPWRPAAPRTAAWP